MPNRWPAADIYCAHRIGCAAPHRKSRSGAAQIGGSTIFVTPSNPLIFVHFPKAGGSSLLRQFQSAFGSALAIDAEHDPFTNARDERVARLEPGIAAVHGHFHPGRYDSVKKAFRATLVRHPVSNIISIYYYWRFVPNPAARNPLRRQFHDENPTIEEFARYPAFRRMMSETYFGDYDMDRFEFIGFFESRDVDIPQLGRQLGIELSASLHVNETPDPSGERAALLGDDRRMQAIRDILNDDIRYYEHLRARR